MTRVPITPFPHPLTVCVMATGPLAAPRTSLPLSTLRALQLLLPSSDSAPLLGRLLGLPQTQ